MRRKRSSTELVTSVGMLDLSDSKPRYGLSAAPLQECSDVESDVTDSDNLSPDGNTQLTLMADSDVTSVYSSRSADCRLDETDRTVVHTDTSSLTSEPARLPAPWLSWWRKKTYDLALGVITVTDMGMLAESYSARKKTGQKKKMKSDTGMWESPRWVYCSSLRPLPV